MVERPRGTVAFLFTDLEGSTRLWRELPEAMPVAYVRHDAILRQAIAGRGGCLYKVIGDAVQAAFPTARAAVAAALEAQQGFAAEHWTACGLPEPLRVRMALHAGSVDPDDDGEYRSPVLNRLGRLLDAAHGGQVLLTPAMYGLVWDALPSRSGLRDLGEQRLKDLDQPSQLFQLLHPDLEENFPPLRSVEDYAHNLPAQPTAFLGRENDTGAVADLVRRSDARLVTLTGPGGIGKTQLSMQVARQVRDDFPDGVWFVELAPITDPDQVPDAIASVLRVRPAGDAKIMDILRAELAEKRTLLVVDNFEQVTGAGSLLTQLLLAWPGVKLLVTSRVPLHIRAEREFPVAPLSLPRRQPPPTLEQVTQYEAVRLFVERAQAVRRDFALDNATAPAVAEICHRLDGLPLAIELAAARVQLLDPAAMLARLDKRLPLLTGGAKDLPERQRTLRQTLAWSYDLLPPQEQALFCRLAVFAGGFTLEAAEAVASDDPDLCDLDALEGVERLTEKSLLRVATGEAGLRFGMLETIREFGLDQLGQDAAGEASTRRAHAMYFADLITRSRRVVDLADTTGIAQMIAERANVQAMLHFLLEAGETETALHVTMRLSDHWTFTGGQSKDGHTRLERALAEGTSSTSVARAYALQGLAMIATHQGDHKAAYAAATESLALARAANDANAVMGAIFWLSSACAFANRTPEGYRYMLEGEQIARGMGESEWLGWALWYLGMTGSSVGKLEESRAGLEEGIALSRRLGDPWCEAASLMALGLLAGVRGDPCEAALHHAEALRLYRELGAGIGVPYCLLGLAGGAMLIGEMRAAAWLLAASDAHFERFGYRSPPRLVQRAHDVEVAVRDALGSDQSAQLMAHGRALTTHDAIAQALTFAHGLTAAVDESRSA